MAHKPLAGLRQFLGGNPQPAAVAFDPAPQPLLIHQPADAVPGQRPQHRAEQPCQHHPEEIELPLAHIEASQGHDQFRGDGRHQVFQHHRRKDA